MSHSAMSTAAMAAMVTGPAPPVRASGRGTARCPRSGAASRPISSGTTWSPGSDATASSRPLRVASPSPVTPSSVVILRVTKLRSGLVTMTSAAMIFTRVPFSQVVPAKGAAVLDAGHGHHSAIGAVRVPPDGPAPGVSALVGGSGPPASSISMPRPGAVSRSMCRPRTSAGSCRRSSRAPRRPGCSGCRCSVPGSGSSAWRSRPAGRPRGRAGRAGSAGPSCTS